MMQSNSKVLVAGARGLVGSALVRRLEKSGFDSILAPSRRDVDLLDSSAVDEYFSRERPEYVFMAAAKVGGILANSTYPADFIRDNLKIELNVLDSAWKSGVRKFQFLGSSCIYPKMAPQPLKEEYLLSGPLEPTNEWYAVAKIAGIKLCQAYRAQYGFDAISLMPTNLYGPGDNFDLKSSHVLPALIRKFHQAKEDQSSSVSVWGTGTPRREFLHVDDLADAAVFLMENYSDAEIVNVGTGQDVTIADLATLVSNTVGFNGQIEYDTTKPDGTPRKLLDVSRLNELGWHHRIDLQDGLRSTYDWFLANSDAARLVTQ
jgi:GDP-L-fucose synthase